MFGFSKLYTALYILMGASRLAVNCILENPMGLIKMPADEDASLQAAGRNCHGQQV